MLSHTYELLSIMENVVPVYQEASRDSEQAAVFGVGNVISLLSGLLGKTQLPPVCRP